ncbi:hypothetical protein OF83DRAFT_1090829 [Amylostereum chailletii]|nr:hypothetical protein OF83DRAFT_1090829 [Amylostereum chailletii]
MLPVYTNAVRGMDYRLAVLLLAWLESTTFVSDRTPSASRPTRAVYCRNVMDASLKIQTRCRFFTDGLTRPARTIHYGRLSPTTQHRENAVSCFSVCAIYRQRQ